MTDDKRPMANDICAIGIDVGGTKIAAGVVTRAGELLFHRRLPTGAERGGEAVVARRRGSLGRTDKQG